jgi:hypothetical protein
MCWVCDENGGLVVCLRCGRDVCFEFDDVGGDKGTPWFTAAGDVVCRECGQAEDEEMYAGELADWLFWADGGQDG